MGQTTHCDSQSLSCMGLRDGLTKRREHSIWLTPGTNSTYSRKPSREAVPVICPGKDTAVRGEKEKEDEIGVQTLPSESKSAKFSSITS